MSSSIPKRRVAVEEQRQQIKRFSGAKQGLDPTHTFSLSSSPRARVGLARSWS